MQAALEVQRRGEVRGLPDGARIAQGVGDVTSSEGASVGPEGHEVGAEDAYSENKAVGDDTTPHPHHDDRLSPRTRLALHDQILGGLEAQGNGRRQVGNEDEEQDL
jgi:hypothetical protein